MSTSYIEYKKKGFWVNDTVLIEFAQKLDIANLPDWLPDWVKGFYDDLSKDDAGSGCTTLWLDEILQKEEHVNWYKEQVDSINLKTLYNERFKENLLKILNEKEPDEYEEE